MEQKSKNKRTPQQEKRHRYSGIALIIIVFVLGYLAYNYHLDVQRRAIGNMFAGIAAELNATETPTPQPIEDASVTAAPTQGYRCSFMWSYGRIPTEAEEKIRTALDEAGYEEATLETKAYGEDEVCREGDEIVSAKFLLMNFTPTVIMDVDSETLDNKTAIAGMVRDIAPIFLNLEDIPRIGNIEVGFLNLGEEYLLWSASLQDITTALDDEIDDSALYDLGVSTN